MSQRGKNLHIKASEYAAGVGGANRGKIDVIESQKYKPASFDSCALSFSRWTTPYMSPDGNIYEKTSIVPYVRQHGSEPITGHPLQISQLTPLHFFKNALGEWHCPVTHKTFTEFTKIAAIRATGNVFAYDAIEQLNLKTKSFVDLLTGEPFQREDIVVIQDPTDYRRREQIAAVRAKPAGVAAVASSSSALAASTVTASGVRLDATSARVMQRVREAEQKRAEEESRAVAERARVAAAAAAAAAADGDNGMSTPVLLPLATGAAAERSRYASASLTSTGVSITTKDQLAANVVSAHVQRVPKKKGYVRLVTSHGDLNLELNCPAAPRTCENFLGLCRNKYYDGVKFHRLIKGFMLQGGDPTGTGRGGQSLWKQPFEDEPSALLHDARGVLSMANSGPNTNGSQFFILFAKSRHLDGSHTVFGRVVGGLSTLDAVEDIIVDKDHRPLHDVVIKETLVFADPYADWDRDKADEEKAAAAATDGEIVGRWFSNPSGLPHGTEAALPARVGGVASHIAPRSTAAAVPVASAAGGLPPPARGQSANAAAFGTSRLGIGRFLPKPPPAVASSLGVGIKRTADGERL